MEGTFLRELKFEKYRKLLLAERKRIQDELSVVENDISYSDTGSGQSELAHYDNHPADDATDMFEKEKDVSVARSWRDVIGRIDEALGKIERETYGVCDRCGREISEARLKAVPHAIFCTECQDAIEGQ